METKFGVTITQLESKYEKLLKTSQDYLNESMILKKENALIKQNMSADAHQVGILKGELREANNKISRLERIIDALLPNEYLTNNRGI